VSVRELTSGFISAMRGADVVVIGAGQGGLAASFHLNRMGIDHIVLEHGRVAESWRSRRWDGFTLVSPNWTLDLPGFHYDGPDPSGFMDREEIVSRFDRYAELVNPPLETGVRVTALKRNDSSGKFQLRTSAGDMRARHVVVATGVSAAVLGDLLAQETVQGREVDVWRRLETQSMTSAPNDHDLALRVR
jgi:putative flavoprotein involved in K+ transport